MFLNQVIVLFLFILFFSWSLFLLVSTKKRKKINLESRFFWLMVAPETFLVLLLTLFFWREAILGLVMGINLISFLLIPGLVALLRGQTKIEIKNLRLDFLSVFLVAALPLIFLKDFQLSRNEGLVLLIIGTMLFGWRWRLPVLIYRVLVKKRLKIGWRAALGLLLSTIFFLLSLLVVFSLERNFSAFVLGLLPLALIVSLPEILVNLELTENKPLVFLDGLLIPLVFNTTLILGAAAFVSPFRVTDLSGHLRSVLLFLIGFAVFYFFSWSKKKIDRLEGLILVLYFFLSLVLILI